MFFRKATDPFSHNLLSRKYTKSHKLAAHLKMTQIKRRCPFGASSQIALRALLLHCSIRHDLTNILVVLRLRYILIDSILIHTRPPGSVFTIIDVKDVVEVCSCKLVQFSHGIKYFEIKLRVSNWGQVPKLKNSTQVPLFPIPQRTIAILGTNIEFFLRYSEMNDAYRRIYSGKKTKPI